MRAVSAASNFKILHQFGASNDGTVPAGPLVADGKGNLYGVTGAGGTGHCSDYGCGTVYKLAKKHGAVWTEKVLHNFTDDKKGEFPWGALVVDPLGNLFGTSQGSPDGTPSTAFELGPSGQGWIHTVIYSDGAMPGLLMDGAGGLYGDIGPGRHSPAGAIAELSAGSKGWNYTDLYDFCNPHDCLNGYGMYDPMIWDGPDKLYGTTYYGGLGDWHNCLGGCGVAFGMARNSDGSWTYKVLHRFNPATNDGRSPYAGLAMDAAGNLYGNTLAGGAHTFGTIFKLAFTGDRWKETQLYTFPHCPEGCAPSGTMVFDKAGNLYGTANGGIAACGGYYCGTIFKMTPQKNGTWKYSVVYKFHGTDGDGPIAVILDGNGHLFGTTQSGGKYNLGVAFEITP